MLAVVLISLCLKRISPGGKASLAEFLLFLLLEILDVDYQEDVHEEELADESPNNEVDSIIVRLLSSDCIAHH